MYRHQLYVAKKTSRLFSNISSVTRM